jgi:hypothetical protein
VKPDWSGSSIEPLVTRTEALAVSLTAVPISLVLASYGLDRLGVPFYPELMFGIVLLCGFGASRGMWRTASPDDAIVPYVAIVIAVFAWLMSIARPWFLPLGTGPDLTHHLLLIRYIETHWHLVHEASAEPFLGEMMYYTPGSHVLAAVAGRWTGTNGLHVLHPILAASVALKCGFVFLIGLRILPVDVPRNPIAVAGALSLFASHTFFLGSFVEYVFAAQVVAELFGMVMWWALTAWDQKPATNPVLVFGAAGAAAFLTWPILVGPPLLALALLSGFTRTVDLWTRVRHACIGVAPVLLFAALFMAGRSAWVQLAATGGRTAWPVADAYGWPLLLASTCGLVLALWRRRARSAAVFAGSILTEAAALSWLAAQANNVPYMALKLFYLLIFVQAVLVALALGETWHLTSRAWERFRPGPFRGSSTQLAWTMTSCLALLVAWSVRRAPGGLHLDVRPAVSRPLELAGEWARANVSPSCVEYLVPDDETAYWLHLAMLGNPRMSARTGDNATYELTPALVRWLTPGGLPYAIADLPALPRGVRDELNVIARFDTAAVVKRRGPSTCAEAR